MSVMFAKETRKFKFIDINRVYYSSSLKKYISAQLSDRPPSGGGGGEGGLTLPRSSGSVLEYICYIYAI